MPYFTLPFTLPTMVFINVDDTRGLLHRIEHYSFPEKQTYDWYKSKRVCNMYYVSVFTIVISETKKERSGGTVD